MSNKQLRIVKLSGENFKRLNAVELSPEDGLTVIGGENMQGKSSVLDLVKWLLGGKKQLPADPVRHGADMASGTLDLGDIIISRSVTTDGKERVSIKSKDGKAFARPESMLQALVSPLSFDALEFERDTQLGRLESLRMLLGLDFAEHDRDRTAKFDTRTDVNREAKRLKGELQDAPYYDGAPEQEVSATTILAELEKARVTNAENQRKRDAVEAMRDEFRRLNAERDAVDKAESEDTERTEKATTAKINALGKEERKELDRIESEAKVKREVIAATLKQSTEDGKKLSAEAKTLKDLPTDELETLAKSAEENSAKTRANARHKTLTDSHDELQAQSDALTSELTEMDAARSKAISEADYPVEGLVMGADGVMLGGVPFEQASQAERLKASIAIGCAMNPDLKVILSPDGCRMTPKSRALLAKLATEAGVQVILEIAGEAEDCHLVIENGAVKT